MKKWGKLESRVGGREGGEDRWPHLKVKHKCNWKTDSGTDKEERKRMQANRHLQREAMKGSESEGRANTEGERRVGDAGGDQSPMARGVVTLKRVNGQEPNLTHLHTSSSLHLQRLSFPPTAQRSLSPLDSGFATSPPLAHRSVPYFICSLWVLTYTPTNTNTPWRAIKAKSRASIRAHITHRG